MKPNHIDAYLDTIIDLMVKLGYTEENTIRDKVRMGITPELHKSWALNVPHPPNINEWLDELRKTGHILEDAHNFQELRRRGDPASHDKDEGVTSSKKEKKKKERSSGKPNTRPFQSSAPKPP